MAGSDGNIYSIRNNVYKRLSAGKCSNGNYLHVNLVNIVGKRVSLMVHIAICLAFTGPKPSEDFQVRHADGNSFNNLPDNLSWSSVKDNLADKILHGTDDNGLRNTRAKLSKEKLFVIKWLLENSDLTHEAIASIVKENRPMISKINNRSRYSRTKLKVEEL